MRLGYRLRFEEKKILIICFFPLKFQLLPFGVDVFTKKSLNKVERLQRHALSSLYSDYVNPYDELFNKFSVTVNKYLPPSRKKYSPVIIY